MTCQLRAGVRTPPIWPGRREAEFLEIDGEEGKLRHIPHAVQSLHEDQQDGRPPRRTPPEAPRASRSSPVSIDSVA